VCTAIERIDGDDSEYSSEIITPHEDCEVQATQREYILEKKIRSLEADIERLKKGRKENEVSLMHPPVPLHSK